jgi:hypothetical protein
MVIKKFDQIACLSSSTSVPLGFMNKKCFTNKRSITQLQKKSADIIGDMITFDVSLVDLEGGIIEELTTDLNSNINFRNIPETVATKSRSSKSSKSIVRFPTSTSRKNNTLKIKFV